MASTASSPAPLAPAGARPEVLPVKPIAPAGSPAPQAQGSVTSREWVIPPRPKPGRKPANDTPPTKRKAQNRAAQRAFRERRAARVSELEEQISKIEEENERAEAELKEQIDNLSKQLTECKNNVQGWRNRCEMLERELLEARRAKDVAIKASRTAVSDKKATGASSAGCEYCSPARCQCIDDAFDLSNVAEAEANPSPKRPTTPSQGSSPKRHKSDAEVKSEPEDLEIDFTHSFTARRQSKNQENNVPPTALVDPCGFCQDGTPCICAEMAADHTSERPTRTVNRKLAPIQNMSQFTPPPSEADVSSEPLPSINSMKLNPCANGPGTCAQCIADPRSTLFCKSLAASRSTSEVPGGCGGAGNKPGGGCCQTRASDRNNDNDHTKSPVTLSCSDTFTALSRHPHFHRAADDLNSWLPRLHALPSSRNTDLSSRPVMEVEAASVMGVLRYFDRRFAKE